MPPSNAPAGHGIAPALGLRAGDDVSILPQTKVFVEGGSTNGTGT
jgi:hypothetical protein